MAMAMCPACNHDVRTPFFLNLDAWTYLRCPHCETRLEMKPPRSFAFGPLMAPLFVLARQGRVFEVIAFVFAFAMIFAIFLECLRPRMRLRKKAMPKPEIRLNINGPSS
jgi:DNA-directed RNA polymerase subunit RPC12/RpoP